MSNRGLSEQPTPARRRHAKRVEIDWDQPDPYQPKRMLSWRTVWCWCLTPWSHW